MKTNETTPILCGTDFSGNAAQAANAAAALAARAGQPLLLVHVADEFNAHAETRNGLAQFLKPGRMKLQAEAARLRKAGAEVEVELLHGSVAEKAILERIGKHPPALVVVSSVSKTAFDRWTLGSVSERLAESLASPTLVVRDAAPFDAWARGERALKVFVAADFASVSEAPLCWVAALRKSGPCEVTVAHVDHPQEERERLGVGSRALSNNSPAVQRVLERDLKAKVRARLGDERVRVLVEPVLGRPDARLIELATAEQADVIVVGTHQRHGLSRLGHHSVSRGILRHAPLNVVCVPPSAAEPEAARIPQLQRVLVATDFSELGDRAVPYAYALLREGGTVFLIHVTHPMPLPNPLSLDRGPKMAAALAEHTARMQEAAARLRTLIPSGGEKPGVASEVAVVERSEPGWLTKVGLHYEALGATPVIESADPALAICQAAERFDADVICLGSHGRTGLAATFMGSVAQAVLAQSPRPVLVVRPPAA